MDNNSGFGSAPARTYFKIKNGNIVISVKADQKEKFSDLSAYALKTLSYKNDNGDEILDICFGHFEGYLHDIEAVEKEFNGSKVKSWQITFINPNGEMCVWNTYYDGSLIQNFVNSLSSVKGNFGLLKLQPWLGKDKKGNQQTKLTIYHNGDKLGWAYEPDDIPKVLPLKDADGEDATDAKGNVIYNTKKRMAWMIGLIADIRKKIKNQEVKTTATAPGRETIDSPDDDDDKF